MIITRIHPLSRDSGTKCENFEDAVKIAVALAGDSEDQITRMGERIEELAAIVGRLCDQKITDIHTAQTVLGYMFNVEREKSR